jgi:hypothetical protein
MYTPTVTGYGRTRDAQVQCGGSAELQLGFQAYDTIGLDLQRDEAAAAEQGHRHKERIVA